MEPVPTATIGQPDALTGFELMVAEHSAPGYEEIARLAYSYWEERGFQGGSALEDWLRAEREIRQQDSLR